MTGASKRIAQSPFFRQVGHDVELRIKVVPSFHVTTDNPRE